MSETTLKFYDAVDINGQLELYMDDDFTSILTSLLEIFSSFWCSVFSINRGRWETLSLIPCSRDYVEMWVWVIDQQNDTHEIENLE